MTPHYRLALCLLVVAFVRQYGWQQFPVALSAEAWNIGGAFAVLLLVALVARAWASWPVVAVACWWAFEELQVVVCGVVWIVSPWQIEPGAERCSDWLGIPMSLVGSSAALCLAACIYRKGKG